MFTNKVILILNSNFTMDFPSELLAQLVAIIHPENYVLFQPDVQPVFATNALLSSHVLELQ